MKRIILALVFVWMWMGLFPQEITAPETVLGFPPGEQFSRHHQIVDYFELVEKQSPLMQLHQYGETPEGRPLLAAIITSESNHQRLDEIRLNNLKKAGFQAGRIAGQQLAVLWMSYNVHGDEAVCSEAAMVFLHELLTNKRYRPWLDSLVVIIDPCLNPDGRDRYVNGYRQTSGLQPNADPESWEHRQTWPGGRLNHYLFDLNRDWAWQSQAESQQRVAFYQQWMPQIHVDFHEMGYNSPYFFAPAAEPYHPQITSWQRRFQQLMGANHATYFDQNRWLYYTGEIYDLYYPSYGDTWPIFNGAQGFTYEQGGSGKAGRLVRRNKGDSLYLRDRLAHHLTTSISTVEMAFQQRNQLISGYNGYFLDASTHPTGRYKSYIIKNQHAGSNIRHLCELLDRQQISYDFVEEKINKGFEGYAYFKDREGEKFSVEKGDMVISSFQPQGRLVQVLFEPHTALSDSLTYDLTAWSLPYAYHLEAYACESRIELASAAPAPVFEENRLPDNPPYAIFSSWGSLNDVQLLAALLQNNISVRYAKTPLLVNDLRFERGTLIMTHAENKAGFEQKVVSLANKHQCALHFVDSGMLESHDLGSDYQSFISKPHVALIGGKEINPSRFGEIWYFFEQELHYPISLLNTSYLAEISLEEYDIIILPSGDLGAYRTQLLDFTARGGKLIVLEKAMEAFADFSGGKDTGALTQLARKSQSVQRRISLPELKVKPLIQGRYEDQERSYLSNTIAGSIYRLSMDNSHPLSFGFGEQSFWIKRNKQPYPLWKADPDSAQNVGVFGAESHIMGFVGSRIKEKVENSLALGVEKYGKGQIIYMTDSPIFRSFWHSGKLMMGNAIFF